MIIDLHSTNQVEAIKNTQRDYKLAFTSGCFDLFHGGHVFFIKQIRKTILKDANANASTSIDANIDTHTDTKLLIAIHSDKEIKKRKGSSRPVLSQDQRAYILDNIKGVDMVSIWDGWLDIIDLVKNIRPDYMATTADKSSHSEEQNAQTSWLKIVNEISAIPIIIDKKTPYLSTTELISKINEPKE
jgi:bifunctional ADP-heptose synthase (sugar kinase/adenylyltransferase)